MRPETEPSLDALQRRIRAAVVAPEAPDPAGADALLVALPGLDPAAQIALYRDGWFSRLRGALAEDYPGVERVLGHGGFDAVLADYLRDHPSSFADICRVGHALPAYLAAREGLAHGEFLAELAHLEWAVTSIFDHPDVDVLRPEDLADRAPEELAALRLRPAASTRVFRFRYPVGTWLEALRDGGEAPPIPDPAPETVTVSRAGSTLSWAPVDPAVAPVLHALLDGATVEESILKGTEGIEDPETIAPMVETVRLSFARWLAGGMFQSFAVGGRGGAGDPPPQTAA